MLKSSIAHHDQQGFTLVEIIAVLVLLGILAAVAVPKYMDLTTTAREKAAQGQLSEVKGRLNTALNGYKLKNNGAVPDGTQLLAYLPAGACPTADTLEGDFNFLCAAAGNVITITISKVQGTAITANNTATYTTQ